MAEDDQELILSAKFDAPILTWAPRHSIFGLYSHSSKLVEIYRITFEVEKIVDKVMNEQPQSLQFSDDGNYCVISFTNGRIGAFKVDTLNEITSLESVVS
jgi:hypothetical protein